MYRIGLWASHQTTRKLKLTDDDRRKHNATICYSGQALVVTGLLVAYTTCSSSSRGVSEWVGGMVVRWFSNMAAGNNNGRPCRTLALYLDTHGNGVLILYYLLGNGILWLRLLPVDPSQPSACAEHPGPTLPSPLSAWLDEPRERQTETLGGGGRHVHTHETSNDLYVMYVTRTWLFIFNAHCLIN